MLLESLLAFFLITCGAPDAAFTPNSPTEYMPPEGPPQKDKDHYFCCDELIGKGSGDGCEEILESRVVLCDKVLYCEHYQNDNGKVDCLD